MGLAEQQLFLIPILSALCRKDDPIQPCDPSVALFVVRILSWPMSRSVSVTKRHLKSVEVTPLSGVLPLLRNAVVLRT